MKKLISVWVACFMLLCGHAQSLELQQLRVDIEKLAQLRTMLAQMKQGYQVLEKGYNSVRDAAKGNFDLHRQYLDGLLQVSTVVRNSGEIKQITENHAATKTALGEILEKCGDSRLFSSAELLELKRTWGQFERNMAADKKAMDLVLTDGAARMSDAERISLLTSLNASSVALLNEARMLVQQYAKLLALRTQQKKDVEAIKKLRGVK